MVKKQTTVYELVEHPVFLKLGFQRIDSAKDRSLESLWMYERINEKQEMAVRKIYSQEKAIMSLHSPVEFLKVVV